MCFTDSFIVQIKNKRCLQRLCKDVDDRFDTSNYKLERLLSKVRNKKNSSV